jgi:transketolase
MGMAPAAYVLFARVMKHDPQDPLWPDRDRFLLSAGHGSMLLYSVLHLAGYDLPLEELKKFRQWGSLTPGHPSATACTSRPGVEVTTGPLGQGFANGVGMAMAEEFLRHRYGAEVQDHFTYAIVSDGDLMEGVAAEAASHAGQLGLGRLIYLYDDNDISLDGPTSLSFSVEDRGKRFEAYGWQVLSVDDANDVAAIEAADRGGQGGHRAPDAHPRQVDHRLPVPEQAGLAEGPRRGARRGRGPRHQGGHGLGSRRALPRARRRLRPLPPGRRARPRGARGVERALRGLPPGRRRPRRRVGRRLGRPGRPLPGLADALRTIEWSKDKLATRSAGKEVMAAMADFVPTMVGGAADLSESTKTEFPGGHEARYEHGKPDRNVFWGVREHGMGGAVNGLGAHGGIVRPYGSTFLQFADYMRGSIRLSALTQLGVAWVYTHDSVALGEDGPTHQPVEHLAALRAIPAWRSSAPRTPARPRRRGGSSSRISRAPRCSSSPARTWRSSTGPARSAGAPTSCATATARSSSARAPRSTPRSGPPTCSPRTG